MQYYKQELCMLGPLHPSCGLNADPVLIRTSAFNFWSHQELVENWFDEVESILAETGFHHHPPFSLLDVRIVSVQTMTALNHLHAKCLDHYCDVKNEVPMKKYPLTTESTTSRLLEVLMKQHQPCLILKNDVPMQRYPHDAVLLEWSWVLMKQHLAVSY